MAHTKARQDKLTELYDDFTKQRVDEIHEKLGNKLISVDYHTMVVHEHRPIILVTAIHRNGDDEKTILKEPILFYRSTGTNGAGFKEKAEALRRKHYRHSPVVDEAKYEAELNELNNTRVTDVWFPFLGIVLFLEYYNSSHFIKPESILQRRDPTKTEADNLRKYGRFMDTRRAEISAWLSKNQPDETLFPVCGNADGIENFRKITIHSYEYFESPEKSIQNIKNRLQK